jgi:hypothetical protein
MGYLFNHPWPLGFLLCVALAMVLQFGCTLEAHYQILADPNRKEQKTTIRDGLFVLLSLLLGFTLTLAAGRFSERRSLLVQEAVSLGTTYLRAETLPDPYRGHSMILLRQYVDTRLDLDKLGVDDEGFRRTSERSRQIQHDLWADAVAVARIDRTPVTTAYIQSLNQTIDLDEERVAAFEYRVPPTIWLLIFSSAAIAVFTRGLTIDSRFWLTLIVIPFTIAIVVALISDLDASSGGLLRLDERALQRLQSELQTSPCHSITPQSDCRRLRPREASLAP